MRANLTFTVAATVPDDLKVGDQLAVEGIVTVHSTVAELVDVSAHGGTELMMGETRIGVYANPLTFAAVREP